LCRSHPRKGGETVICTTLNRIRKHNPCVEGYKKLLQHLGKTEADDEPLSFNVIVESNGIKDALWACRTAPEHDREWRLFAVWCARQVQHLMTDQRSHDAINVAERFALGAATKNELAAAYDAAKAATWSAANTAALFAAKTAALFAAGVAAGVAACDAAWDAAWAAAEVAACDAARAAACDAARAAAKAAQTAEFLRVVTETECCEAIRARTESDRREEFFRKFGND
jgi:hypothetical protein